MALSVTLITALDEQLTDRVVRSIGEADELEAPSTAWPDCSRPGFAPLLADELIELARGGNSGAIAIELGPTADPVEIPLVLRTMLSDSDAPVTLTEIVTIARFADIRDLLFREQPVHDDLDRHERLALQLEFATTIVIADLLDAAPAAVREVQCLLRRLNPTARMSLLAPDGSFRRFVTTPRSATVENLGRAVGWMLELGGRGAPPTTVDPVGAFVYRDPRPFHPTRLAAAVEGWLEPADAGLIVRSRGLVRLASRPDRVASWSIAGQMLALDPTAMTTGQIGAPTGQEIAFFGRDLNADHIIRTLDACLLDDGELIAGPMEWATYVDPFPAWHLEHGH